MMNTQNAPSEYQRLVELLAEIEDLSIALAILDWDEQTQMPSSGAQARADQKATLEKTIHAKTTDPQIGRLLESLTRFEESLPPESDEAGLLRTARRQYHMATCLPEKLVTDYSRARSRAFRQWLTAREEKDFQVYRSAFEEILDYSVKVGEALTQGKGEPLAGLLDRGEPGMTLAALEKVFSELKTGLVPLVKAISERLDAVDDNILHREYDLKRQWSIGLAGVRAIGFKLDEGRADESVHPFSTYFSPQDVRITTRTDLRDFGMSFFAFLHEAGHGHYMQGIPQAYRRSPLAEGASSGMHESQSRTWENLVGRSRGFWRYFYPKVQETFPEHLADFPEEEWYRAVNRVQPSLIRVEADEVTYNLHIMIRFELEKELHAGTLAPRDLADAWNAKFQEYLGIEPQDDLEGVLQDIHWTMMVGAAFQSYTLGNVMALQLYDAALGNQPDMAREFDRGDFSGLLAWSRKNVHAHGTKFFPQELLRRATGSDLTTAPFLAYIEKKFGALYGL